MLPLATAALLAVASAAAPDLGACLRSLQVEARAHGIERAAFERFTAGVQYDARRALPDTAQPEFTWPIWEYLGVLVDDRRVADGRLLLQQQAGALAEIERRFGVDPATVVAVFGVETDYGTLRARWPVVETLVNRACGFPAARPAFRREQKGQLFAALALLQSGDVQPEQFLGSRAGAFGMTQFMPGTFVRHRADIDGDGRADIINSVPDALGSTARFLVDHGWQPALRWSVPVALPSGLDAARASTLARQPRTIAQWRALGLRPADMRGLTDRTTARLLLLDGVAGPAFLVTANFAAFRDYNNSDAYAFAIGRLADLLRGETVPELRWSSGESGLSRDEVRELQQLLAARGHALVPDGVPGSLTREAVRAEQRRQGWPDSGWLERRLLTLLRAAPSERVPP